MNLCRLVSLLFTPIPCTYNSSPLDGMARNYFSSRRARNSSCLDPFYSYLLIPKEKKNIWRATKFRNMDLKRAYHLLWVLLCLPIAREQGKVTLSITSKALLLKFNIFSHYHPYPSRRSSHFVPSRYMIFPILFFISEM